MAKEFSRSERISDSLQKELSLILQMNFRDPRVGMVNVNAVKVSKDLSVARVYVTFVQSDIERSKKQITVLNKAVGYLRTELAKVMTMRSIPRLYFVFDESIDYSQKLSALIDQAVASDKNL